MQILYKDKDKFRRDLLIMGNYFLIKQLILISIINSYDLDSLGKHTNSNLMALV